MEITGGETDSNIISSENFGGNDYIVKVAEGDNLLYWTTYHHVRKINGEEQVITANIDAYEKTSIDHLIITGIARKRLYDLTKGEYITPEFNQIKETKKGIFAILDIVKPLYDENLDADLYQGCTDYYYFEIDSLGNILSPIKSLHENSPMQLMTINEYEKERLIRQKELLTKATKFKELIRTIK